MSDPTEEDLATDASRRTGRISLESLLRPGGGEGGPSDAAETFNLQVMFKKLGSFLDVLFEFFRSPETAHLKMKAFLGEPYSETTRPRQPWDDEPEDGSETPGSSPEREPHPAEEAAARGREEFGRVAPGGDRASEPGGPGGTDHAPGAPAPGGGS